MNPSSIDVCWEGDYKDHRVVDDNDDDVAVVEQWTDVSSRICLLLELLRVSSVANNWESIHSNPDNL